VVRPSGDCGGGDRSRGRWKATGEVGASVSMRSASAGTARRKPDSSNVASAWSGVFVRERRKRTPAVRSGGTTELGYGEVRRKKVVETSRR